MIVVASSLNSVSRSASIPLGITLVTLLVAAFMGDSGGTRHTRAIKAPANETRIMHARNINYTKPHQTTVVHNP